ARRQCRLGRRDRPVDQGIEPRLVFLEVEANGIGRLDRGAVAQDLAQALEAVLGEVVDFLVAGGDVGQANVERALERLLFAERRRTRSLVGGLGVGGRQEEDGGGQQQQQQRGGSGTAKAEGAAHQPAHPQRDE